MGFVSIQSIITKNKKIRTRRPCSVLHPIALATDLTKRNEVVSYAFRITISKSICSEARFILGDYIDILFDRENNKGLIKRVKDGKGWKLSSPSKNANRYNVKLAWLCGLPSFKESVGVDAVVTDDGILFDIPEQAQWEENARKNTEMVYKKKNISTDLFATKE